jgi:thioredoxin-like negative regulator of GroEL
LLGLAWARLRARENLARVAKFAAIAVVALLAFGTHMRAWSWQTWSVIVTQGAATHPGSMRAQLDLAALFIKSGQADRAYGIFANLRASEFANARNVGAIDPVVLDCQTRGEVDPQHLAAMRAVAGQRLGTYEVTAVRMLVSQLDARPCAGLGDGEMAAMLRDIATRAPQDAATYPVSTLHHIAADFFARAGDMAAAREEARIAWDATRNPVVGLLFVRLLAATQQYDEAQAVLAEARERIPAWDWEQQRQLSLVTALLRESARGENAGP